jgi:hypothetical protein
MDNQEEDGRFEEVLSPDRDFVVYKRDGDIIGGGYQISPDIQPLSTQAMMGGGLADDLLHNLVVPSGLYMHKRAVPKGENINGGADIPSLTEDLYARLLKIAQTPEQPIQSQDQDQAKRNTHAHTRKHKSVKAKKTKRRLHKKV